ncbi:MAG: FAD-linked oxidase C-terminal domain-containing protein [Planctomycetota bacterium]
MPELPVLPNPTTPAGGHDRDAIARGLVNAVRGEVRFGAHDRLLYATDASIYQVEPIGVVVPESAEDAEAAVRFCAGQGVPMLPRGGGTSLAGQCVNEAVVIDVSPTLRAVRSVDAVRRRCSVDAGITIDAVNRHLDPTGLFFAPDPSTVRQATIGGCIGNNAAGTRSIKYGRTAENLLGVDVVTASGLRMTLDRGAATRDPAVKRMTAEVIDIVRRHEGLIRERFPKTLRRNAGYALDMILAQLDADGHPFENVNLSHLICGSEGTLALTLGAELTLHTKPTHRALGVLGFASVDDAIAMVEPLLAVGPGAVELLDDLIISMARSNLEYREYVELMPTPDAGELAAVLYVELLAQDEASLRRDADRLCEMAAGIPFELHTDASAMARALKLRQAGEPLLHAIPGERKPLGFVEDNAVPVERLGEFVREFRSIVESYGTRASFYAHASVGVLHVRPLLSLRSESDRQAAVEIAERVAALAKSLGGVMSGEHGDGRARGPLLEQYFGPELMRAFAEVKAVFDPNNLMNPGDIIAAGAPSTIVEQTRIRPGEFDVPSPEIETAFDFSGQGGFAHAAEMCNGAGVCRKTSGGTMCPSYLATLDERHSTRGRANALRLMITGQLSRDGAPAWDDAETAQTLDLCLSCKACKAECPSNVDVAKLKAEALAQRFRSRGRAPIQAHAFGRVRLLNRLASIAPGISNGLSAFGLTRGVMNRVLGLAPERSLPRFEKSLFRRGLAPAPDGAMPTVLLFGDCFTAYNETSVGTATVRLLGAFGYRALPVDVGCCARSMISTGLLKSAQEMIDRTARRLRAAVQAHDARAVIVAEPSCLSAIKDDWLELPGSVATEERRRLAEICWLPEQFLEHAWDAHPRRPMFEDPDGPVLLHGHCHQKALWGLDSSAKLLRRAFGSSLVELDSGCCGLAGSFGFTADRYDLSMRIGELSLFGQVRDAGSDAVVVAPGTSCRHQMLDGLRVKAVHPVELLEHRLATAERIDTDDHAPLFAR